MARSSAAQRGWTGAAVVAAAVLTLGTTASPATAGVAAGNGRAASSTAASRTVSVGRTVNYNEGKTGYCTWWAIDRFHAYSGLYPDFHDPANGLNAGYWAAGAAYNGWTVASTARADSIAVFPPGVDGAGSAGHAAWVTAVSGPQVTISEMNGPAGWDQVDNRTITPDSSVSYILAPAKRSAAGSAPAPATGPAPSAPAVPVPLLGSLTGAIGVVPG